MFLFESNGVDSVGSKAGGVLEETMFMVQKEREREIVIVVILEEVKHEFLACGKDFDYLNPQEILVQDAVQPHGGGRNFRIYMYTGYSDFGMYYARLRSSWEELSHSDSFIEWPASAPSENIHPPPTTAAEIYAKIAEKTRVFQFLAGLNPDFEYAQVHLLDRTPFPTPKEAHAYCLSD
ncbi:hypothetical protein GIB67_016607 [Kingdonia uniflora]|uniref:Uncharacterized protein n=1 Tax=Kingdonia uniflora TaxID=39325 RepID=A0A7J7MZ13_9MAGN|nr:hypothetical protein GIB67_016607 [Kingdonia uniflora]